MNQGKAIRVMVVDDCPTMRRELSTALNNFANLVVVSEAISGSEAICLCNSFQPDVVLIDLMMSGLDSITVIRLIGRWYPLVQCIGLVDSHYCYVTQEAVSAGVCACFHKDVNSSVLAEAIRAAYNATISKVNTDCVGFAPYHYLSVM